MSNQPDEPPQTRANRTRVFALVAAAILVSAGLWWLARESLTGSLSSASTEAADVTSPADGSRESGPRLSEIAMPENGRLQLTFGELPTDGPLLVQLDLPDEAVGTGLHAVRIVSERGERSDAEARRSTQRSGLTLSIERRSLPSAGRYLIEIDTTESHPLSVRRYVLELR